MEAWPQNREVWPQNGEVWPQNRLLNWRCGHEHLTDIGISRPLIELVITVYRPSQVVEGRGPRLVRREGKR
jgi:hypothetical protein